MRVVVHDYSGHPFQVQLSRELAARGHHVLHLYCRSFLTPRGAVQRQLQDSERFAVEAVDLGEPFEKYSPVRRVRQERTYGKICTARVERFEPDVVLSSNTPLFAQQILMAGARRVGARFVFWQQDVYSTAMQNFARKKLPIFGDAVGKLFVQMERRMVARSDRVIVISEDFRPILRRWNVADDLVDVVENWAPLEELGFQRATTGWAQAHDLAGRTVLLYAGTLGLKHNPSLLLELARSLDGDDVRVVVISEGIGADWLRTQNEADPVDSLVLLPFQPYEILPEALSSADILIAILEPDAGVFSVPSKVLSYHCARRPILAAIPPENLSARIITTNGSGVVVDPTDQAGFVRAARHLIDDPDGRRVMGERARAYAERTFDISGIAERFERILSEPQGDLPSPFPQNVRTA